jgi:hypothetical protein
MNNEEKINDVYRRVVALRDLKNNKYVRYLKILIIKDLSEQLLNDSKSFAGIEGE